MEAKRFDLVSQHIKDLCNGYIKEIQKLLPSDVSYFVIPKEIYRICCLFYYLHEGFDSSLCCDRMTVSENDQLITNNVQVRIDNSLHTVYNYR